LRHVGVFFGVNLVASRFFVRRRSSLFVHCSVPLFLVPFHCRRLQCWCLQCWCWRWESACQRVGNGSGRWRGNGSVGNGKRWRWIGNGDGRVYGFGVFQLLCVCRWLSDWWLSVGIFIVPLIVRFVDRFVVRCSRLLIVDCGLLSVLIPRWRSCLGHRGTLVLLFVGCHCWCGWCGCRPPNYWQHRPQCLLHGVKHRFIHRPFRIVHLRFVAVLLATVLHDCS